MQGRVDLVLDAGSSPLARGLRRRPRRPRMGHGIIPARAGFTRRRRGHCGDRWDHPRSRGVYNPAREGRGFQQGSSPLARGLLCPCPAARWAGADHPRSRGVYESAATLGRTSPGSSPLARGLHLCVTVATQIPRIIPARAGFTTRGRAVPRTVADHPRSRGVYGWRLWVGVADRGSSPLARGLHLAILGIPTTTHPTRRLPPSLLT